MALRRCARSGSPSYRPRQLIKYTNQKCRLGPWRLPSTGISSLDSLLGGEGYPDRSAVLVTGAPGIGKEALGYWFTNSGLAQSDFCAYVTRLATREVLKDAKAFGLDFAQRVPLWIAREGGEIQGD